MARDTPWDSWPFPTPALNSQLPKAAPLPSPLPEVVRRDLISKKKTTPNYQLETGRGLNLFDLTTLLCFPGHRGMQAHGKGNPQPLHTLCVACRSSNVLH